LISLKRIMGKGRKADPSLSPLFFATAAFLTIWTLFGGNMPVNAVLFAILALAGTAILGIAFVHGGRESLHALSWPARILLGGLCLVPLAQLVPLPPSVWQTLPGRELATATLGVADVAQQWRPITLSIEPTFRTALVSIWLAAFLVLLLRLPTPEFRRIFALVFVLGLVNAAIGMVQVVSGGTLLVFYPSTQSAFLSGLFANKNHAALFIAITLLAGYAALYGERGWSRRWLGLAIPVTLLLLAALLATFSRAGLVLGLVALAFLALLSVRMPARGRGRYIAIAGAGAILIVVTVALSTDLASRSLARFESVDADLRWSIWQWSWPLVGTYFPVGGGIGTYPMLFPPAEQLAWVKPTYVNHAHNDYLEQLIEIGALAPVFWTLMLMAITPPLLAAWRDRRRQSGRLGLIAGAMLFLIATHSAVDYPLRRPAIAVTAMVAFAAVLRMGDRGRRLYASAGYARQSLNEQSSGL
jgi:O-antigen ligase